MTDGVSADAAAAAASDRLEPRRPAGRDGARGRQLLVVLALVDVLVDGRPDDLPARVRLRLRLAGLHRRAATATSTSSPPGSSPRRCCSRARSRRCTRRSSSTSSSTPTTRSSPRRSTPRSWSPARRCGSRRATGVYGCVPMLVGDRLRARPELGHAARAADRRARRPTAGRRFGIFIAAKAKKIESFSYWQSGLLTPMFLVAGTFFPLSGLPQWAQVLGNLNPLYHCVQLVRDAVFGACGLGRRRPLRVPRRLRAHRLAARDPLHGAQAHPLRPPPIWRKLPRQYFSRRSPS